MLFKMLYPYEYVESVFAVSYEKLYRLGYRGIIFDIDNTLVPHGADSTPEIDALFRYLHKLGMTTLLLSNNGEERIQRFLRNIDALYLCNANKPNPAGYRRALEKMGLSKKEVVFIGDQVFTDIFGANRCGVASILTAYIRKPNEMKIGIRRKLERFILKRYKKSRRYQHRIGDILKEGERYAYTAE